METTSGSVECCDEIEVWVDDDTVVVNAAGEELFLSKEETLELIAALQACVDELPEDA